MNTEDIYKVTAALHQVLGDKEAYFHKVDSSLVR